MRIIEFIISTGDGGMERHAAELCEALSHRHEVHVIAAPNFTSRLRGNIHPHPMRARGRFNPLTLLQLWWRIYRIKPDVIHAHANKSVAMLALIKRFVRAPIVGTVHGVKRNTRMFNTCNQVIAVSKGAAAKVHHPHVHVIYNGIPPLPDSPSAKPARPTFLAAGRLVRVKAFDVLIEAWQGIDAELLIAGAGPEEAHLRKLIASLKLESNIKLIGFRRDLPMLIQNVSAVLMPSEREGFSYVAIETLQMNIPLLTTFTTGMAEVLPPDLLVPPRDVEALRTRIQEMIQDPERFRQLLTPVFERSRSEFTLEHMAKQTEAVLRQALTPPSPFQGEGQGEGHLAPPSPSS